MQHGDSKLKSFKSLNAVPSLSWSYKPSLVVYQHRFWLQAMSLTKDAAVEWNNMNGADDAVVIR